MSNPLAGVRVLDLTQNVAGPYCTMLLGDLGADVIKVERPGTGDDARAWAPPYWERESATFLAFNRNKRSVALDLKADGGRSVLWSLLERSDVFVQSLRPGSLERLGFGYGAVAAANPRIVYCSLTAYGGVGPLRDQAGYDPLMQAYGGLMSVTGEAGAAPVRVGTSIVDMGTGLWTVIAALAALRERDTTGRGTHVETSLFETAIGWMSHHVAAFLATGESPGRHGSGTPMMAPYEAFATADGHLMVAAANDGSWHRLCRALGDEDLLDDPRFRSNPDRVTNRDALVALLAPRFATRTTAEWLADFEPAQVPCAAIRATADVVRDPQTAALGMVRALAHPAVADYADVAMPVSWDGQRAPARLPPPQLGADTRTVLRELGLRDEDVDALARDGAVGLPRSTERTSAI